MEQTAVCFKALQLSISQSYVIFSLSGYRYLKFASKWPRSTQPNNLQKVFINAQLYNLCRHVDQLVIFKWQQFQVKMFSNFLN